MLKAVLFDIDGVLLDSFEANVKYFQNIMEKAGRTGPTADEYKGMFHLTLKDAIKKIANDANDDEVEKMFKMALAERTELYPTELVTMPSDAPTVVMSLSESYPLALVTSRVRDGVFSIPQLLNLKSYFKVLVAYEDSDKHKPEPEPLLLACQKLGIQPGEGVYIGDAKTDQQAAEAAGMKFILFTKEMTFTQLIELIPKAA